MTSGKRLDIVQISSTVSNGDPVLFALTRGGDMYFKKLYRVKGQTDGVDFFNQAPWKPLFMDLKPEFEEA